MLFQELYSLLMESDAPRSYSCLMLDLSFLQKEFRKIQEKICPCEVYDLEKGHGLEDSAHVTCKYGIHEIKASSILSQLELKPITLKFTKLSLFEHEKYDVLKFDVQSKDLKALNKIVSSKFECTDSYPDYHPHSTVAYCMPGCGHKYVRLGKALIGKEFTARRYIFSSPNSDKVFYDAK